MKQTFKQGKLYLTVETNWLKNGELYFGEKDIEAEFEHSVKATNYARAGDVSDAQYLVMVYKHLTEKGIKPNMLCMDMLSYSGERMTDFNKQKTIEE